MKFLLMFLSIYGGMHAYFVWRIHRAFPQSRAALIGSIVFSFLMIAFPFAARIFEERLGQFVSAVLTIIAFSWPILLFWFFMLGLFFELWNVLLKAVAWRYDQAAHLSVSPLRFVLIAAVVITLASLYSFFEAGHITSRTVVVPTPHLKPGDPEIRIVQLSDIHLGVTMRVSRLRRIARIVRELQPDIIVDTGDQIDHETAWLTEHLKILGELEAPLGKYAVTGNHEFYVGIEKTIAAHEKTGFELLRGRHVNIDNRLILAGVDDPAGSRRLGLRSFTDEAVALPERGEDGPPVIFLKHQPVVRPESVGRYDLQLSGHIHGGQVWPFRWFVALKYDYGVGTHKMPDGSHLLVSPGTGSWGAPMRLGSPPKVVLIRLVPAE